MILEQSCFLSRDTRSTDNMSSISGTADPPRVFDIILEGELLRDTLGESLVAKSVSTESAVVVEYTLLAVPPKLSHSAPQSDWYVLP